MDGGIQADGNTLVGEDRLQPGRTAQVAGLCAVDRADLKMGNEPDLLVVVAVGTFEMGMRAQRAVAVVRVHVVQTHLVGIRVDPR